MFSLNHVQALAASEKLIAYLERQAADTSPDTYDLLRALLECLRRLEPKPKRVFCPVVSPAALLRTLQ
jgi:hypothetical protein